MESTCSIWSLNEKAMNILSFFLFGPGKNNKMREGQTDLEVASTVS